MKYKAVIFDLDGLVVDTEILESQSWEKLLTEYNKTPKFLPNGLLHEVGGGAKYYESFKEKYHIDDTVENIKTRKRLNFEEMIRDEELTSLSGLDTLLETLKNNNFLIALASNRSESFIYLILDKLKVTEYFDVIVGPSEDRKHKPSPDMYLHVAKELGLNSKDCVVLEDSEIGITSANAAGMKVIAVPNIYTKKHDFSKADIIVHSMSDVNTGLLESL